MVFANVKAWQISRDSAYLQQAVDLSLWLFKQNPAKAQMYFPATGIAFDGIDSPTKVNKNSGQSPPLKPCSRCKSWNPSLRLNVCWMPR
ncbi:Uncharacterised protein [Serratia fonticola]|uniref:Uncharacterized protein n=1 Tax=Serratia fonticola TaxID=47917 RepID=A0A4V6KX66_SERFO|nr:Uncharacterised protein [Serratia fonticola]